ncbi:ABC transporter substrate-binding protein [Nocardioides koreensis]|uniref:ABC transporter substrate-binding protein n=1 Tax=Nocardioides koreensis TaxID=433651 RepID=A0ABN2ZHJ1_9ACTN
MRRGSGRRWAASGVAVLAAMALTGCLQQPGGGGSGEGLNGYVDNASADGDGKVTMLGAFAGEEQAAFEKSLAQFEKDSGIDIAYTADADFTTTIKQKVRSGDTPDIGLFPQPGGLLELADQGYVQPIDTYLDYDQLESTLVPGFLEAARLNGRVYGAPMRMANKSIVWYPKQAWDKAGYQVPETMADLEKLTAQIKSDGTTPWCMAWGSDQATGWVGTDWIEQFMLMLYGPDVYDQWVKHEIPFDDPKVVAAFDAFDKIARTDGEVYGGVKTVVNTPFAEAMVPAFKDPPGCMLERQGNFEISFLDPKIQDDLDNQIGVFQWPAEKAGEEQPLLGGADLAALFNGNDEDAIKVMEFLTSDKFGAEWAQAGGWLSPHTTFDESNYPDQTTKDIADMAKNAPEFVFDASDAMPKEVGSGTFWTGMVEWVQGKSSEDTTKAIESSWPQ